MSHFFLYVREVCGALSDSSSSMIFMDSVLAISIFQKVGFSRLYRTIHSALVRFNWALIV